MNVAWVTGAGGLIGSHIVRSAPAGWRVVPLTRGQLDLGDFNAVRERYRRERPDLVIHCGAISKSGECEQHPETAWRINCDATRVLAECAGDAGFIFFSTDLVFDGRAGFYNEASEPNPLTVYAKTKAAAERAVLENPRHTVIRTSLNGGTSPTGDRGFTDQLLAAWRSGLKPKLFADEFRSPLMAEITARATWVMATQQATGVYHVAGAERLSRYEIGVLVAARVPELHPQIQRASLHDYPGPPRAPDTSLDSTKAQALLGFLLPRFSEWVEEHWQKLLER